MKRPLGHQERVYSLCCSYYQLLCTVLYGIHWYWGGATALGIVLCTVYCTVQYLASRQILAHHENNGLGMELCTARNQMKLDVSHNSVLQHSTVVAVQQQRNIDRVSYSVGKKGPTDCRSGAKVKCQYSTVL